MSTREFVGKMNASMKTRLWIRRAIAYVVLIFLALLCIFPLWLLIVNSTRSTGSLQASFSLWFSTYLIANVNSLLSDTNIPIVRAFLNSLLVSTCSSVLAVYFSALTAYGIHVYNFKGKNAIFTFILLIMMIPTQVSALGLVSILYKVGMLNNYWPLILPSIASPVVFFYLKQYLESILPYELVEAARVDGSTELMTFHRIVLPIMKPALAVQFIFCFVSSWNNYFVPALLINKNEMKTLPLIIAALKASDPSTFDLGKIYVLIAFSIIPLLIIYLIFSRFIIKGLTLGAVKG
jgi:multiple sugar transport system permease protein